MSDRDSIVGLYFHSFTGSGRDSAERKRVKWQGLVHARVDQELYLVRTFSWITGDSMEGMYLINVHEMLGWDFYESAAEMADAWERTLKHMPTGTP